LHSALLRQNYLYLDANPNIPSMKEHAAAIKEVHAKPDIWTPHQIGLQERSN
jgi:hypothetical protein